MLNKELINQKNSQMCYNINKIVSSVSLIFSIAAIAACSSSPETKTEEKKVTKVINYPTTEVQFINPEYEISVPAELKPYEQVDVHAKVGGFVKQLLVDRGDYVRKGQLLAVLEAPEMEQSYLSSKSSEQKIYNDYIYAKQAYERLEVASQTSGAVAGIELDRARTAMKSAKSAYDASKAGTAHSSQLKNYLRITAPFDGVVSERNVSVGALLGPGANIPLFRIAQGNKLRLTLSLPEKHVASIQENMPVQFTVSSQPGHVFQAKLSRTSGLLDQRDRSLTLEFDVTNDDGKLKGGDYAQAKLKLKRKEPSFWIPNNSILTTQSGIFVLGVQDNEVRRIVVKEGIRLDTLTEIFGDIALHQKIIIKPSEEIKEGKIN